MLYADFAKLSREEAEELYDSLSEEDVNYLRDQRPFHLPELMLEKKHIYFDQISELHTYLLENVVPLAKPWRADEIAAHELAHAECALAVGAVGVKYSVRKKPDPNTHSQVYTHAFGPAELPNLAFAAIVVHPYDSTNSLTDMGNMREYGYGSRGQIVERIARWNERNNGLLIPAPQTWYTTYSRT